MAWVGSTLGFQAESVPSSVANTKTALPDCPLAATMKSVVLALKTMPVGLVGVIPPAAVGMRTTSGWGPNGMPGGGVPKLYKVATPAPLSFTQNGLVMEATMPQGLTSL